MKKEQNNTSTDTPDQPTRKFDKSFIERLSNAFHLYGLTFEQKLLDNDGNVRIDEDFLTYIIKTTCYHVDIVNIFSKAIFEKDVKYLRILLDLLCLLPFDNKTHVKKKDDGLKYVEAIYKIYRLRDILTALELPQYNTLVKDTSTYGYSKYLTLSTTVSLEHELFKVEGTDTEIYCVDNNLPLYENNVDLIQISRKIKTMAIENALKELGIGLYLY